MKWNWEIFLKAWLFIFLGFLLGIVSTVIYLALNVDLSQFDGTLIATIILAFATVTLVIISYKYAKSTEEMLEEQRKSREIAFIERRLEKLYYPMKDVLSNPYTKNNDKQIEWKKVEAIVPFQYLAYETSKDITNEFIRKVIKSKNKSEKDLLFSNFKNNELKNIIINDIEMYEKKLNEFTMN